MENKNCTIRLSGTVPSHVAQEVFNQIAQAYGLTFAVVEDMLTVHGYLDTDEISQKIPRKITSVLRKNDVSYEWLWSHSETSGGCISIYCARRKKSYKFAANTYDIMLSIHDANSKEALRHANEAHEVRDRIFQIPFEVISSSHDTQTDAEAQKV